MATELTTMLQNQIYLFVLHNRSATEAQLAKAFTGGRLLAVRPVIQSLLWSGWLSGDRHRGYVVCK